MTTLKKLTRDERRRVVDCLIAGDFDLFARRVKAAELPGEVARRTGIRLSAGSLGRIVRELVTRRRLLYYGAGDYPPVLRGTWKGPRQHTPRKRKAKTG